MATQLVIYEDWYLNRFTFLDLKQSTLDDYYLRSNILYRLIEIYDFRAVGLSSCITKADLKSLFEDYFLDLDLRINKVFNVNFCLADFLTQIGVYSNVINYKIKPYYIENNLTIADLFRERFPLLPKTNRQWRFDAVK